MATTPTTQPAVNASAQLIAQTAARLMAAKGYEATSVRDIVEACHVTKPTLYYHFKSKKGLAQALVTVPMTQLVAQLEALNSGDASATDRLTAVLEAQFAFCREDPDRARFVYAVFFGPMGAELSAELAGFGQQLHEQMGRAVAGVVEAGHVEPTRSEDFLSAVRGMVTISTVDFLYREQALGPDLARRIVTDLLRGFAARPAPDACTTTN